MTDKGNDHEVFPARDALKSEKMKEKRDAWMKNTEKSFDDVAKKEKASTHENK